MILPDMQSIPGGGGQTGEGARDARQTRAAVDAGRARSHDPRGWCRMWVY